MLKRILISAICAISLCGCMNLYTRCPGTEGSIEKCYQSTSIAAGSAIIVAFPQCMSDNPSDYKYELYNILTVPLGCLVAVDAACEFVLDTVFSPFDYCLVSYRKKEDD